MRYWAEAMIDEAIGGLLRSSSAFSFAFLKAARRCGPCSGAARVAPSCRRQKGQAVRCELVSEVASLVDDASRVSFEGLLEADGEGVLGREYFRVSALLLPLPLLVFRRKTRRDVGMKFPARWLSTSTRSSPPVGRASSSDGGE